MAISFEYDSVIRGYHIYKEIWEASHGETFDCVRETGNRFDPFAVAVIRDGEIIGHVPKLISAAASLFLRHSGSIKCKVTGSRQYSRDLPQGGLEIPCQLTFEGSEKYIGKVKKLLKLSDLDSGSPTVSVAADTAGGSSSKEKPADTTGNSGNSNSKAEADVVLEVDDGGKRRKVDNAREWIRIQNMVLRLSDKAVLLNGELNDKLINAAQKLLLQKFPSLKGLRSTLVQDHIGFWVDNYLQVVHSRSNHWITVVTIGCQHGKVKVYDSLYNEVDTATKNKLEKTFACKLQYIVPRVQKQQGVKDCGLFAVAFATDIAHGKTVFKYDQSKMRNHLCECFEQLCIDVFP